VRTSTCSALVWTSVFFKTTKECVLLFVINLITQTKKNYIKGGGGEIEVLCNCLLQKLRPNSESLSLKPTADHYILHCKLCLQNFNLPQTGLTLEVDLGSVERGNSCLGNGARYTARHQRRDNLVLVGNLL